MRTPDAAGKQDNQPRRQTIPVGAAHDGRRPLILVADDDEAMRDFLSDTLRREGYEVESFSDGTALMRSLLQRKNPDGLLNVAAIVCDVRMTLASGFDVLAHLRRWDRTTPVVMITAFGDAALHGHAARSGANAMLDKPFAVDELTEVLRDLVQRA